MPSVYYQRIFVPGSYYHIYNRGAHKQNIFHDHKDYQTFTQILVKQAEGTAYTLLCYCLMPNHFRLMLRQDSAELPVSNLMKCITTIAITTLGPFSRASTKMSYSSPNIIRTL